MGREETRLPKYMLCGDLVRCVGLAEGYSRVFGVTLGRPQGFQRSKVKIRTMGESRSGILHELYRGKERQGHSTIWGNMPERDEKGQRKSSPNQGRLLLAARSPFPFPAVAAAILETSVASPSLN